MSKLIITMIAAAAFFTTVNCRAQIQFLSPKNVERINRITAGKERILKYHKLLKRDSVKRGRMLRRKLKHSVDSALRSEIPIGQIAPFGRVDIRARDMGKENPSPGIDSAYRHVEEFPYASLDSVEQKLRLLREFDTERNFNLPDKIPGKSYTDDGGKHILSGNTFALGEHGISENIDFRDRQLQVFEEPVPDVSQSLNSVPKDADDLRGSLKTALSNKTVHLDDKFRNEIQGPLIHAQLRVAKLLSRYQSFTSLTDSTFGVRRSSLEGRQLKERLFAGCNFVPQTVNPFSLDVTTQLGYKVNKKVVAGVALNYRLSFADTLSRQDSRVYKQLSYTLFSSVNLWKSWYGVAELETTALNRPGESRKRPRRLEGVVGVGRRFLIHPKVYFNATVVYRLLHNDDFTPEGKLQCRVGFSLSELATRKKSTNYNPNY